MLIQIHSGWIKNDNKPDLATHAPDVTGDLRQAHCVWRDTGTAADLPDCEGKLKKRFDIRQSFLTYTRRSIWGGKGRWNKRAIGLRDITDVPQITSGWKQSCSVMAIPKDPSS